MTVSTLTLRRAAALREKASLGCSLTQASIILGLDNGSVSYLKNRFKIALPIAKGGRKPWLMRNILRDYGKPGMDGQAMATRYGVSRNGVYVTITRLRKAGMLPPRVVR